MGLGYTRQSAAEIVDGEIVEASPLNAEFNALQSAFNSALGHTHDGTIGEGPKISLISSITGILPVANGGFGAIHNVSATLAPTVNEDANDGYGIGSFWFNTVTKLAYVCVDPTVGAAVWASYQLGSAALASIAGLTTSANQMLYTTGANAYATTALTPFARTVIDDTDASSVLTTLGVSTFIKTLLDDADAPTVRTTIGLGNMALQNSNAVSITGGSIASATITGTISSSSVSITGGSITGINDLAIADGGTGASDVAGAKTNFGLNNVDNTSDVNKPVSTAQAAADATVLVQAAPPGLIGHFAQSTAPTGWLKANGALVSRTTYAALYAQINTTYGAGDGTTTFALPDYRGYFLRGLDDGRGVDSGRSLGSTQTSQNLSHTHTVTDPGHNHGHSDPGHAHSVYDPGHAHGVNDPGHTHQATRGGSTGGTPGRLPASDGSAVSPNITAIIASATGISIAAAGTGIGIYAAGTGMTNVAAATGVTIQSAGGTEARPVNISALICIKY